MSVQDVDATVAPIAAAIGEPARARMLYCLIDGRARTSTELAIVADEKRGRVWVANGGPKGSIVWIAK